MKLPRPALLLIALFTLGSCSSLKVSSTMQGSGDFSKYTTYSWITAPAYAGGGKPRFDSPQLRKHMHQQVDAEMQKRGFRLVNQGSSDLLVAYFASVAEQVRVTQVDTTMGFSSGLPHYMRPAYMMPSTTTLVDRFEKGDLIVGVGDAQTRQLLWRGVAQAEIRADDSKQHRENRVSTAVSKMFRSFPKK
ncbi:MAG: DUF4136 domain-containing protein [Verrucomicrobiales bacterium]|nr:DUF4136 domain-containing protein [Verrucomicrobiales bacterium]